MRVKSTYLIFFVAFFWLVGCSAGDPELAEEGSQALEIGEQSLQQHLAEQTRILREMKSELTGIRQEIRETSQRLARSGPSERERGGGARRVSIDDDYVRGKSDAPLTLIEFSDFQCPFCAQFYKNVLPQLDKKYIQTGKLKFVYRDFPIASLHKDAFNAAGAANCAGEQGKFWAMHDLLFENIKALGEDHLNQYAGQLGLNMKKFSGCLDSQETADEISKDLLDGQRAGVGGTPGFFLGRTTADGTIEGLPIKGARSFAFFEQIIGAMLQERDSGT